MALKTWPTTIRGNDGRIRKDGFGDQPADNILRGEMDDGHKSRRKFTRGWSTFKGRIRFPLSEYEIFREVFIHQTLKDGALSFLWNHPLRPYNVAAKFLPQDNGRPYTTSDAPGANIYVDFELEYLDRAVA